MLHFRHTTTEAIHEHARESYPEECCGFVLTDGESEAVRRITNVQNQMHELDPAAFPRDATRAYFMDSKELLAVYREVDSGEWSIKVVYHSHPKHDASFSPEDKRQALFDDEPMYPGAVYLVVSIYDRQIRAMRAFEWDDVERDFVEVRMGLPQRDATKGGKTGA
jgi:adenylyltransferase/sulfurtransferase